MRVQIPAYTDRWMMGDRYGEVVNIVRDRCEHRASGLGREIARVKLDKSGKIVRVLLDDCTEV
jgi:hypothetical protein